MRQPGILPRLIPLFFVFALGCLGDEATGSCEQAAGDGPDGGTAGPSSHSDEKTLRPPPAASDGGCTCPVVTGHCAGETGQARFSPDAGPDTGRGPDAAGATAAAGATDSHLADDASTPHDAMPVDGDLDVADALIPSRPGQLVITEIMGDPAATTDSAGEWFEVHHPGSTGSFNLKGCEVADDEGLEAMIDADLMVMPGGFAVIARSDQPGFAPDAVCPGLTFRNSSPDQVILLCNSVAIDRVAFSGSERGTSLSLDPSCLDDRSNDDPSSWCLAKESYNGEDRGTPGTANPVCNE